MAAAFATVLRAAMDGPDESEPARRLVQVSTDVLGVAGAGVLLDRGNHLESASASDRDVEVLQTIQLADHQGPGLAAFDAATPVSVDDLRGDATPWPRFAADAARLGFRSVTAVPLRAHDESVGILELYGDGPGHLDTQDERLAGLLADATALALVQRRSLRRAQILGGQLQAALQSRTVIEQAKGIVACRGDLGIEDAYRALRRYARDHNLTMATVSGSVVSGRLRADELLRAPRRGRHREGPGRRTG